MVKRRVRPRCCVVALFAGLGEAGCYVVWIGGALVVLQVATHAGGAVQIEVVVDMTVGALTWRDRMSCGKGKTGGAVIELRAEPGVSAVAESAVG